MHSRRELAALAALLLVVTGLAAVARAPRSARASTRGRGEPGPTTAAAYVGASACAACHPGEHASFRRTFHRTMTQLGSPESIAGPLAPEVKAKIVLVTGSHREQAYWTAGERPGDYALLPDVFLVREGVLLPRTEAFLHPPNEPFPRVRTRWASSCIACHAVAGEPRHDIPTDSFDVRVAELGVACESCHGPGAAHADRHRDPVARYSQRGSLLPDPTIVHPGKLSPERSAAVCGQCHAYAFPKDEDGWWTEGYSRSFRPGDLLDRSRTLLALSRAPDPHAPVIDAPASAIFWPDGSVRVGGREYNGLVESPCFVRGAGERKLTCLSCHAMHAGAPEGQIAPDRTGDRACTTCHADARAQSHAHHASGSSGAACVACHMPKTSYALLDAARSHRIDSPRVSTDKPNACNLCHLDQSPAWTARWLATWYGIAAPAGLDAERQGLPAGLYDALAGDAAERAIVAAALGAPESRAVVAKGFAAPILDAMKEDPYAAVRFIAARSRKAFRPGQVAPPIDAETALRLRARRDDRPVTIAE